MSNAAFRSNCTIGDCYAQQTPPEISADESTTEEESTPAISTPEADATMTAGPDSAVLAYVPGGEFQMGSSEDLGNPAAEELPLHDVKVESYWIDKFEVTNSMFGLCVAARLDSDNPEIGCDSHVVEGPFGQAPYYGTVKFANYPVVNVTWYDALEYCTWAGRQLPTEAEWELAARGPIESLFPWEGEVVAPGMADFVYGSNSDKYPSPVGSFPRGQSQYGVLDMAGNVWEWVDDWYGAYPGSSFRNPDYGETHKTVSGGSFANLFWDLRTARRREVQPFRWEVGLGFRCAMSFTD